MSTDAKIWFEPAGDGGYGVWHSHADPAFTYESAHLVRVIDKTDDHGGPYYWYPRAYPDGQAGLVGYSYPRKDWKG